MSESLKQFGILHYAMKDFLSLGVVSLEEQIDNGLSLMYNRKTSQSRSEHFSKMLQLSFIFYPQKNPPPYTTFTFAKL